MNLIMANLNLGQDVANKRERKKTAAPKVIKSYPLQLGVKMRRYSSLININPSAMAYCLSLQISTNTKSKGRKKQNKLPTGSTNLLKWKKTEPGFPRPHRISDLIRKVHAASVTLEELEEFLIKMHSPNRKDGEFNHYSKVR